MSTCAQYLAVGPVEDGVHPHEGGHPVGGRRKGLLVPAIRVTFARAQHKPERGALRVLHALLGNQRADDGE